MIEIRTTPVTGPGFYDMSADAYHADPCPEPSLSHTIAKLIAQRSPRHAKRAHPRLGGRNDRRSREMSLGSAVHTLTLGRGAALAHMPFDNYRTKDAQHQRDVALAQGFIPLLTKEYELAEAMAAEARPRLETLCGGKLTDLLVETVAVAQGEDGQWLRMMGDIMTPDLRLVVDLKTCASAEPEAFAAAVNKYYATQPAFYFDILDRLDPDGIGKRRFIFAAQERDDPEMMTFHELDTAALEIGQAQMQRAREKWASCMQSGEWPGYAIGPHLVSPRQFDIDAEMSAEYEHKMESFHA